MLEQKSQCEVEIRQTGNHGTITTRDNYELTRNIPKGVERLREGANFQISFNANEINLSVWGVEQMFPSIRYSSVGKEQRHKTNSKFLFEEIKFLRSCSFSLSPIDKT